MCFSESCLPGGPLEVVLLHLVLQARPLEAEFLGGAGLVPVLFAERLANDLPLDPLDLVQASIAM